MMNKDIKCEFYTVEEIMLILNIGRSTIYKKIKEIYKTQKPFQVKKICGGYRIPIDSFNKWKNGEV